MAAADDRARCDRSGEAEHDEREERVEAADPRLPTCKTDLDRSDHREQPREHEVDPGSHATRAATKTSISIPWTVQPAVRCASSAPRPAPKKYAPIR